LCTSTHAHMYLRYCVACVPLPVVFQPLEMQRIIFYLQSASRRTTARCSTCSPSTSSTHRTTETKRSCPAETLPNPKKQQSRRYTWSKPGDKHTSTEEEGPRTYGSYNAHRNSTVLVHGQGTYTIEEHDLGMASTTSSPSSPPSGARAWASVGGV
jgi:hypothetical protein